MLTIIVDADNYCEVKLTYRHLKFVNFSQYRFEYAAKIGITSFFYSCVKMDVQWLDDHVRI